MSATFPGEQIPSEKSLGYLSARTRNVLKRRSEAVTQSNFQSSIESAWLHENTELGLFLFLAIIVNPACNNLVSKIDFR